MGESELYKELGELTKDKSRWEESIPHVSSLLAHESVKIQAKALWLLGEMGLAHPLAVRDEVPAIARFCDSPMPLLRERAVNALGRIGRGDYRAIEAYWESLFRFASDEEPKVRLSFIWASENIATNAPDIYGNRMPVFERLLHDADDKVRMEAPEIFRVLGKRRPEFVRPYVSELQRISETDGNRVVRIHCLGAIKAVGSVAAELEAAQTTASEAATMKATASEETVSKTAEASKAPEAPTASETPSKLNLAVLENRLSVCKCSEVPAGLLEEGFCCITRTDDEISVVCETERMPDKALSREDGWRALKVLGPLDFGLVGILASISSALADAGVPLFAVSTYDTDYILVKDDKLETAVDALSKQGLLVDLC